MDLVHGLVFVCLFLIGLCAIAHYFRNSALPYVCWIVLFGVGYGVLHKTVFAGLPALHLTPDVILYIFLPVLIFDSSRKLDLGVAREMAIPSTLLATLGILVSMFAMALPVHLFFDLPWIDVLFFCAIMSATDPVAVVAIFKPLSVPEKLKMLIEGESLLNDGTTVILFSLLFGKVIEGRELLFRQGVLIFILSVFGAILIGAMGGWICITMMRSWKALKDHFIGPLLPLLFVYLVFCAAQAALDVSGVIAVIAATLIMRLVVRRCGSRELPNPSLTDFYQKFWEFLGDLANAILFFILGSEIGANTGEIAWKLVFVSLFALLFARSVVVYGFGALFRLIHVQIPMSWQHVLNLGGLKGALSVALVLMIPENYIYRNSFLHAALLMCIFTLVVNTLALRVYLNKKGGSSEFDLG